MRNKDLYDIKQFVRNLIKNKNYDLNIIYDLTINYCINLKIKLNSQEIKDIVDNVIGHHQNDENIDDYSDYAFKENSYLNSLECEDFENFIF